jgi:hypothetical protein
MTDDKNTPDPFDPAQFRAPNTLDGGGDGIRKEFIHIRVGKPKKTSFFRANTDPAYRQAVYIIEDDQSMLKDNYLVVGDMIQALIEETKPKLLVLCVDKMGTPFLWVAPPQAEDRFQRTNLWNSTALKALRLAETKWVRVTANMVEGAYNTHTSLSTEEPDWPELPMSELIKLGFGEERVIRDMNHPLVRRLLGRD